MNRKNEFDLFGEIQAGGNQGHRVSEHPRLAERTRDQISGTFSRFPTNFPESSASTPNCQAKRGPQSIPPDVMRLSDGALVEWVRDPGDPAAIRLLIWRNGHATIQDSLEDGPNKFIPPTLNRSQSKALALPIGIARCEDSKQIIRELAMTIARYVDLPDEAYLLLALSVLCTWFPDCVDVLPYHIICGPTGSGKTTLLQLLRCFCRRGILVGDISSAALYRIADLVSPTFLLDESEFDGTRTSRDLQRFLRAGNVEGEFVARGTSLFDSYCPKFICVNQPIDDVALSTRCIHTFTLPSNRRMPLLNKFALESLASEWLPKLLMFRLTNADRLHRPPSLTPEIESFSPKMKNIALALKVPLVGDVQLESELVEALRKQDADAVAERAHEPIWYVAATLFRLCHPPVARELTVGAFAAEVDKLRTSFGEERELKPRKAGSLLKIVGVRTRLLGNWGRGFEFNAQLRRRIHLLARSFGITRRVIADWNAVKTGFGGPPCELCMEFDLNDGLRFVSLPSNKRKRATLFSMRDGEEKPTDAIDPGAKGAIVH